MAIGGPVAVAGALLPLRDDMRASNVSLVFVLVVLVAAVVGGRLGGAVAALVAAASFDFFFTQPYYSFTINARDDLETTILLLGVGVAVGEVVVRNRRFREHAGQRERDLRRMQRYAQLCAGSESPGQLIQIATAELTELLGLQACWFERPPFAVTLPELGHGRMTVWGDDPAAAGIAALDPAPSSLVALPVFGAAREQGRFVLELPAGAIYASEPGARALAVDLADRVGVALAATGT
jgi:K+-sensing histidine kinase KdpD